MHTAIMTALRRQRRIHRQRHLVAKLELHKPLGLGDATLRDDLLVIEHMGNSEQWIGLNLCKQCRYLRLDGSIGGIAQYDRCAAAGEPRHGLPIRHLAVFERDQSGLDKGQIEIYVMLHWRKTVIGNDRDGALRMDALSRRYQLADQLIDVFQYIARGGRVRTAGMLLGIERGEVYRHECRLACLQQLDRKACPILVAWQVFIDAIGIGAKIFFQRRQQTRRSECGQQLAIVVHAGSPDLRQIPVDVRANADRPMHIGRRKTRCMRSIPQRRHANIAGVPIPTFLILVVRIEGEIGADTVHTGRHACYQRGVAG